MKVARDPTYFTSCATAVPTPLTSSWEMHGFGFAKVPDGAYGLIVLDAFSADAVPVHLLSAKPSGFTATSGHAEASSRFRSRTGSRSRAGAGTIVQDAGMVCRVRYDLELTPEEKARQTAIDLGRDG